MLCREFVDNPVAQLWYFCKCVYFAISAKQLAAGYPTRILGHFLTRDANIVTAALFIGYVEWRCCGKYCLCSACSSMCMCIAMLCACNFWFHFVLSFLHKPMCFVYILVEMPACFMVDVGIGLLHSFASC